MDREGKRLKWMFETVGKEELKRDERGKKKKGNITKRSMILVYLN